MSSGELKRRESDTPEVAFSLTPASSTCNDVKKYVTWSDIILLLYYVTTILAYKHMYYNKGSMFCVSFIPDKSD